MARITKAQLVKELQEAVQINSFYVGYGCALSSLQAEWNTDLTQEGRMKLIRRIAGIKAEIHETNIVRELATEKLLNWGKK